MDLNPIDLRKGHPNPSLLPISQIRSAASAALSSPDILTAKSGLLYAPDAGYEPLRRRLADWLTEAYDPKEPISPQRICITGGASQNLASILQVFSDPLYTRNIWVVSPTYFHACKIFEDSGFHARLRSVPEDEEGINIEYLESGMNKSDEQARKEGNIPPTFKPPRPWAKIYRHFIYAVPTFANPSSSVMSDKRRRQLVALARKHNACIITDDVYDQLQWPSTEPTDHVPMTLSIRRIVDIDRFMDGGSEREGADGFGNAVSNGSFSKIVGPGCRTGWAEGTAKFAWGLSQCGSSRSGGAPSQLCATFMDRLLETGDLQRHIEETLQPAYARRYYTMMSAVEKHLRPLGVSSPQPDRNIMGGYFIWLSLPGALNGEAVALRAKEDENLAIMSGPTCAVKGDEAAVSLDGSVRLCFAWEEEEKFAEGIERLGRVIEGMINPRGQQ